MPKRTRRKKREIIFPIKGKGKEETQKIVEQFQDKWKPEYATRVEKYTAMGMHVREMAELFDVTPKTINHWRNTHPEFGEAVQRGFDIQNRNVENAFYKLAVGFSVDIQEVHISKGEVIKVPTVKYYPPNHNSAWKWLTTRYKEKWTDTKTIENNINVTHKKIDMTDLSDEELKVIEKGGIMKALNLMKN